MIISGTLIAISLNPVLDVCSGGGHSMVYALDICDGAQHVCAWTTPDKKLLPTPVVIETPVGEKLIFGSEGVGSGDTTIDTDREGAKIPAGIFWWQEINK